MSQWKGKTNASLLGIKILVFILHTFGLGVAYFILRFVASYYFFFAFKSNLSHWFYYRKIHKFSISKSVLYLYKTYYVFGQTLLDKLLVLSKGEHHFRIQHDGSEHLQEMVQNGKGGILVSGHIGNWDIAGQLLNGLKTKFNVLIYENEKQNIKAYLDQVQSKREIKYIVIQETGMGHIIELNNAFKNNELVVMHGDRFRDDTAILNVDFMGQKADFASGPFVLASKFGVPISFVFSIKESNRNYHLYSSKLCYPKRTRSEEDTIESAKMLLHKYVQSLEAMVIKHPDQWFNFYQFWKK